MVPAVKKMLASAAIPVRLRHISPTPPNLCPTVSGIFMPQAMPGEPTSLTIGLPNGILEEIDWPTLARNQTGLAFVAARTRRQLYKSLFPFIYPVKVGKISNFLRRIEVEGQNHSY